VTIYNLELRASEDTLSRWARLQSQSLVAAISRVDGRRPVVNTIAESLSQHNENMLYRPHLVG
jgi:hypothetical protein